MSENQPADKTDAEIMCDKLGAAYKALAALGSPRDTAHKEDIMGRANNLVTTKKVSQEYAWSALGIKK